ncbi:MAG: SDR family NAD(P)-dependent oxidoreductase, partial [Terriglobales bacterium]
MFRPDLLKNKRILITGGGTGLGKGMAKRFLELGATVHICGRREEVLEQTATALGLGALRFGRLRRVQMSEPRPVEPAAGGSTGVTPPGFTKS